MLQYYSQLGQDVHALALFERDVEPYFVDIGAHDGITLSNTYLLEKNGWKGLCIEANPRLYSILKSNRGAGSTCLQEAVFSETGKVFSFREADLLGGITDYMSSYLEHTKNAKTFEVTTRSLNDILLKNNAPTYIQFLSIDTEGSELEILRGIDFETYSFGLISLEHNFEEPRRTEMECFLKQKGYGKLRENHWDDDYVKWPV